MEYKKFYSHYEWECTSFRDSYHVALFWVLHCVIHNTHRISLGKMITCLVKLCLFTYITITLAVKWRTENTCTHVWLYVTTAPARLYLIYYFIKAIKISLILLVKFWFFISNENNVPRGITKQPGFIQDTE